MALQSTNPDQKLIDMAITIDHLSGQVAALLAYIQVTTSPLDDLDIKAIQAVVLKERPVQHGPYDKDSPNSIAMRTIDRIVSYAAAVGATRVAVDSKDQS